MPSWPDKMDSMFFVCIFIFVLVIFLILPVGFSFVLTFVFVLFCFGGREKLRKRDKKVG